MDVRNMIAVTAERTPFFVMTRTPCADCGDLPNPPWAVNQAGDKLFPAIPATRI